MSIILPVITRPKWPSSYAYAWREFLRTDAGEALLVVLAFDRPDPFAEGSTADAKASRADRIFGYERCEQNLLFLKEPVKDSTEVALDDSARYPSLDDAELWPKGGITLT